MARSLLTVGDSSEHTRWPSVRSHRASGIVRCNDRQRPWPTRTTHWAVKPGDSSVHQAESHSPCSEVFTHAPVATLVMSRTHRHHGHWALMGALAATVVVAAAAIAIAYGTGNSPPRGAGSRLRGGPSWSVASRVEPGRSSSLYGVSCPNSRSCLAVDETGSVVVWDGRKWSSPEPVAAGGTLTSVSCPSASFCAAVSAGGSAVTFNGHSWSSLLPVGPAATYKLSCPTTTFCAAVGASGTAGSGSVATFDGHSWTTQSTSATGGLTHRFLDVSCATPEFCLAVNLNGQTLRYDGHTWSDGSEGPPGLMSVSCPASSWCLAITGSGRYTTFDGTSWSMAADIPDFSTAFAYSVSCASTARCTALGLNGMAVTWHQGLWSMPVPIFPGGYSGTVAVSCGTGDFCMAVNSKGEAASN